MSRTADTYAHAEGASGAATATLAADTERAYVITHIHAGSDKAVGVNQPQIAVNFGGVEKFVSRMQAEAPWDIPFPNGIGGAVGEAATVVLTGGGGSSEVHLNVGYRKV